MKIRFTSDLHCEFYPTARIESHIAYALPPLETDADTTLILAGDLFNYAHKHTYIGVLDILTPRFQNIIIIPGNHEWYRGYFNGSNLHFEQHIKQYSNIHFLNRGSVIINDTVFIGATMWTNYNNNDPMAKLESSQFMNDYWSIRDKHGLPITPDFLYNEHKLDIRFLLAESRKYVNMKKVIITHHGPSTLSVHEKYKLSGLSNYSFMSDLEDEIYKINALLWVHGHTHERIAYKIGDTEVRANPLGYPRRDGTYENIAFECNNVMEI